MSPISVLYHRNIEKKIYNVSWKNLFQTNTRQSVSVLVQVVVSRRATSGAEVGGGEGGGEVCPAPFLKIEKSVLILEKWVLFVYIYGLKFSFKLQF